jgi:hypothetical protein
MAITNFLEFLSSPRFTSTLFTPKLTIPLLCHKSHHTHPPDYQFRAIAIRKMNSHTGLYARVHDYEAQSAEQERGMPEGDENQKELEGVDGGAGRGEAEVEEELVEENGDGDANGDGSDDKEIRRERSGSDEEA